VKRGYTVVLACRSDQAAKAAVKGMQSTTGQGSAQFIGAIDLASPSSIRTFADTFKTRFSRLDLLVNNAGCNFLPQWHTESGVVGLVQVLFPIILTLYRIVRSNHVGMYRTLCNLFYFVKGLQHDARSIQLPEVAMGEVHCTGKSMLATLFPGVRLKLYLHFPFSSQVLQELFLVCLAHKTVCHCKLHAMQL
jgi:hypothetical protein